MTDYTIKEIIGVFDAQYGKKRIALKTNETGDRSISLFTQFPDSLGVGKTISGDITEKIVNGKTYYNFAFAKKDAGVKLSEDGKLAELYNLVNLKMLPMLTELYQQLVKKREYDYPEFNESNDAHGM